MWSKDDILKIIEWFKGQQTSFQFYLIALICWSLLLGITIVIKDNEIIKLSNMFSSILIIFGMIYDTVKLLNKIQNTLYEKFVYLLFSIAIFFTYIQAESLAKQIVYSTTKANPDLFETSVAYLAGLYFIPSFFLVISPVLVIALLLAIFTFALFPIVHAFQGIKDYRKISIHIAFYCLGVYIAVIGFLETDIEGLYKKVLGDKYVAIEILRHDYYKNQTCNTGSTYIKHLDDGMASMTNVSEFSYSLLSPSASVAHDIEFQSIQCQ